MPRRSDYTEQEIDAVREIIHTAWFRLQSAYDSISGDCVEMGVADKMVLSLVFSNEDIILRDIREALGLPHSTLTSIVDRLEQRGLLRRIITDRDRRSYGLELTDAGHAYKATHDEAEELVAIQVLDVLGTSADRASFIRILSKVVHALEG